jgi:hypothetical protein
MIKSNPIQSNTAIQIRCSYISSGNHDGIGFSQNLVVVFQSFLIFNFGNNFDFFATVVIQQFFEIADILARTDKRCRNEFDLALDTKFDNILDILFGKGRQFHLDSGQIHIFAFADATIVFNAADDFASWFVATQDGQDQTTIRHENLLAWQHTAGQLVVTAGQFVTVSLVSIIGRHDECLTLGQRDLVHAIFEKASTNLGSFGVQ